MELTTSDMWAQGVGTVAAILNVVAFLCKGRQRIVAIHLVGSIVWALHFGLLGAMTGVAMNAGGVLRQYVFLRRSDRLWAMWSGWPWLFIVLFSLAAALTWQGWPSLFPLGGMIAGTLGLWQLNTRRLRQLCMASPPLWFCYNVVVRSYPGMVTEVCLLIAQIIGWFLHESRLPWFRKRRQAG